MVQTANGPFDADFMDRLHALTVLWRLGAEAKVLAPDALRDDVLARAAAIIEANREGAPRRDAFPR